MLHELCVRKHPELSVDVYILSHSTHQQHEVVKPLSGLVALHRSDPGSLVHLGVGRQ